MACSRLSVCSESLFGICHTLEEDLPRPGGGGGTGFMCQEDCHPQVDLSPKSFRHGYCFIVMASRRGKHG